ncbi:MAG: M15 family metallopeptidase [Deltaproteobacteria bacterium]|nr:M15 family metallopeptidase [Deltaproteobacteria bacterium]
MRCQYVIQPDDTFENIALQFYNEPSLADKLRQYNGLHRCARIFVGQVIDIPAAADLRDPGRAQDGTAPPHGFEQILDRFGNIYDYYSEDGGFEEAAWCADMMTVTELPFSAALSWDPSRQVRKIRCHRKLADIISDAFCAIREAGLAEEIMTVGDCYNFRTRRVSRKLSTHCWGIALDINPELNMPGSTGRMPQELVELFGAFGFAWGGTLPGRHRAPMHFQFCRGY